MRKKPYENVTLQGETTHHFAEHEILLSFLNDEDAAFFHEWWGDVGNFAFKKWIDERETEEQ